MSEDDPVNLDTRRGMAAQKATEARRLLAEVSANEASIRSRLQELEDQLAAMPATSWPEAATKAAYLLELLSVLPQAQDPRRQQLIANVLSDFERLSKPVLPTVKGAP